MIMSVSQKRAQNSNSPETPPDTGQIKKKKPKTKQKKKTKGGEGFQPRSSAI